MSELFNIVDPEVRRNPYPVYEELRRLGPVVENPLFGIWMVLAYAEAERVLEDPATYSSVVEGDPITSFLRQKTMLSTDPPDHGRLRGVVSAAFTPRSLQALEARVAEVAAELVRECRAARDFDVVAGLANPLPVIIIAELLGVPPSDRAEFKRWSQGIAGIAQFAQADDATRAEGARAAEALQGYLGRVIADRRRTPRDDLIGRMVEANGGGTLSDDELVASCVLLLVAGNETTTNLISNAVLALARHPVERARLVGEPTLVKNAIEEILRFDPPVQATIRTAKRDVRLMRDGRAIAAGTRLLVVLAAANRDPLVFADPDRLDVARANARNHLGYGAGIHFCIGASLARLEARIALDTLLRAVPDFALADPDGPLEYAPGFFLRGLARLSVVPRG